MKVLIVGMRGIGIETAKNLMLQGVGAITVNEQIFSTLVFNFLMTIFFKIFDTNPTSNKDVGQNFFLNEADAASHTPRGEAVKHRLHELNPLCKLKNATSLTDELILSHRALVVTTALPIAELIRLNELCRNNRISFFFAFTGGVSMSIFVDHGGDHVVCDPTGEKPVQKLIVDICRVSLDEARIRYDHPSGTVPESISTGTFDVTEVVGVEGINGTVLSVIRHDEDPVKTVRVPWCVPDASPYICGGLLTEKKLPTPHPMQSLAEKMKYPGSCWDSPPTLVLTNLLDFGAEQQQHVSLFATLQFLGDHGRLPQANNETDRDTVVGLANKLTAEKVIDIEDFVVNEEFVKRFVLSFCFVLH